MSVALHAGVATGLALLPLPPRAPPRPPSAALAITLAVAAPAPTADDRASPEPAPPRAVPAGRSVPARVGPAAPPAPTPRAPAAERASLPTMPSPTAVARGVVVDPSAPTAPPPAPLAPPRAPAAGDPVPGDVGAVVARDGVVHFEERSGTTTEVATPAQLGRVLKHEIKDWIDDPYLYQGRLGDDRRPKAGRWVSQPVSPRALPGDRDFGRDQIEVPLISGTFDVSGDAAHGPAQDPDLYKKQVFLERTRDRRAGMASGERAHLSDEAVYALSQRLAAVWDDARRSPAERRRILFRLWDECEEAGAGAAARATILGFIRRRIPAGSPDAYTPADIDELNRGRTSAAPFAPYAR